jgi:predicted RNase H-like HicB family nuclease
MRHYIGIVHKDRDSSYGISFPDLPGCFSAADDLVDLERNAIEAIDLFLDGEDASQFPARDMNEIGQIARAESPDDYTLMAVPYMRSGGRAVRVNLSIDQATLAAIDEAAARRKLSRSAFLVSAARNEIMEAGGR